MPRVRVVAVLTSQHAACRPDDGAHAGAVDNRAGVDRVEKAALRLRGLLYQLRPLRCAAERCERARRTDGPDGFGDHGAGKLRVASGSVVGRFSWWRRVGEAASTSPVITAFLYHRPR